MKPFIHLLVWCVACAALGRLLGVDPWKAMVLAFAGDFVLVIMKKIMPIDPKSKRGS